MMTIEDFDAKWDVKTQASTLALILEAGLRSMAQEADDQDEGKGAMQRATERVAKDLMQLPWQHIRYIFKRRL